MERDVVWGFALTLIVIGVIGAWFYGCGRADRARRTRAWIRLTFVYAGAGFVIGIAFLNSDLGTVQPAGRLGLVAFTVCCFLLLYAAGWGAIAANDKALVIVNLTGRALLLSDPELAPFYTLPSPRDEPATELPPPRPRTCYVVSAQLGRVGAQAGRTDVFTIDARTASDLGPREPLLVRRLIRVIPLPAAKSGDAPGA